MSAPKLEKTTNYDMFQPHELNHDLREKPTLLESMTRHGFMPSGAIHCVTNGNGKLKVIRGHHRLMYAKRLRLPVWYIVDNVCRDIFFLEAIEKQQWGADSFVKAYAKAGNLDYQRILDFSNAHGINITIAASLVGGESAGSGNMAGKIKSGRFKIGDMAHANMVSGITDYCRVAGISFATCSSFVGAVSAALRVDTVDFDRLASQVKKYGHNMNKRATRDEYLDELEAVYNYRNHGKLVPLKMKAVETMRARRAVNKHMRSK